MVESSRRTVTVKRRAEVAAPASDPTDPLSPQYDYVRRQDAAPSGLGLVFVDAFIRGMREIGYKNPAWALAELVDNSFQAGATSVDIRLKDADLSNERSRPSQIAIIDDGTGMIPRMISYAVRWGGTHRENDRTGFGRYGYGLPSASVSLARRYSVYSRTARTPWSRVEVDLEALAAASTQPATVDKLLEAKPTSLPTWLKDLEKAPSSTIVVLEDLDRLQTLTGWISAKSLQIKLLQHFGVIYRHWLKDKRIIVAGERTGVMDPLFLLPDARYAEETVVRARAVTKTAFEMEGRAGKGSVRIRASILPPNFQLADPLQYGVKGAAMARRFDTMRSNNGILVCRAGRQIDVVSPDWTKFQNYDLNLKIEIDFDPVLDEFFGLTTSKQQIVIDDRMWEKLKQTGKASGGLQQLIKDMRYELGRMRSELAAAAKKRAAERPRPSALAMQAAQKFKTRQAAQSPQKEAAARAALVEYAEERARETGVPVPQARMEVEAEVARRPFDVEFVAREEAPLYQGRRLGDQKRLLINTAHPFYEKVYQLAGEAQSGIELLLFVMADAEMDADGDREQFYRGERTYWSEALRPALDALMSDDELKDRTSANSEESGS